MNKDPVVITLAIAFGLALGWIIVGVFNKSSRGFRITYRKLKCACGFHAPSGRFVPAIGGRDVMRCDYCDKVVCAVERTKDSLRRVK